jgi:hypothetical protein
LRVRQVVVIDCGKLGSATFGWHNFYVTFIDDLVGLEVHILGRGGDIDTHTTYFKFREEKWATYNVEVYLETNISNEPI